MDSNFLSAINCLRGISIQALKVQLFIHMFILSNSFFISFFFFFFVAVALRWWSVAHFLCQSQCCWIDNFASMHLNWIENENWVTIAVIEMKWKKKKNDPNDTKSETRHRITHTSLFLCTQLSEFRNSKSSVPQPTYAIILKNDPHCVQIFMVYLWTKITFENKRKERK